MVSFGVFCEIIYNNSILRFHGKTSATSNGIPLILTLAAWPETVKVKPSNLAYL